MKPESVYIDGHLRSEFGMVRGREAVAARSARIDLGLSLLAIVRKPGVELSRRDIAAWCDCSEAAIQFIEITAFAKIRRRFGHQLK